MEKPTDVMNSIEKKTKTIVAESGVIGAIANAVIIDSRSSSSSKESAEARLVL